MIAAKPKLNVSRNLTGDKLSYIASDTLSTWTWWKHITVE